MKKGMFYEIWSVWANFLVNVFCFDNQALTRLQALKLRSAVFFAFLFTLLASNSGIAQTTGNWTLVNSPNPSSTSRLDGTVAIAANDIWAVGHQLIGSRFENLAMHWNGSEWSVVPTPHADVSPTNVLIKLTALSSDNVWAVGGHGYAYTLHWNGSAWSVVNIGEVPGGNAVKLNDISAVSANDIWAVGQYASDFGRVSTVIMHWDGNSWTRVPSPDAEVVPGSPRSSFLYSVEAISDNNVWAVGEYLVGNKSIPLVEHWNGTNWSIVPSPSDPTTNDGRLFGLSVNSANDIWAVGERDVTDFNNFGKSFAIHWNGSQWSVVPTPHPGAQNWASRLSAVKALSANNVWAVGTATNSMQGLSTFIIHWDGTQWSRVTSPNVPPENSTGWNLLQDITAVSPRDIWTVGYGETSFNAPDVTITQHYTETATNRTKFDFDGDGQADISVFRPSDRVWYLLRSGSGFGAAQFGISTDKITPADFDGDGKTDISVFRDGVWYWINSSNGSVSIVQFGIASDLPVPADFDGDGRDELAVYRNGVWWRLNLSNNQYQAVQFGVASDKPVPADYDGDGKTDLAVYRDGVWYYLRSSDNGYSVVQFGISTDKPVVGDYDGDGRADQAVYREGVWYVLGSTQGFYTVRWGIASDIPAAADYDGDGKTDPAVYRDGVWYLLRSQQGLGTVQFGITSDKPTQAAFLP